jgi:hypothetical protein
MLLHCHLLAGCAKKLVPIRIRPHGAGRRLRFSHREPLVRDDSRRRIDTKDPPSQRFSVQWALSRRRHRYLDGTHTYQITLAAGSRANVHPHVTKPGRTGRPQAMKNTEDTGEHRPPEIADTAVGESIR